MNSKMKIFFLPCICAILFLIFCLSFLRNNSNEKKDSFKTAFINPDKVELLTTVSIASSNGENITFIRDGNIWKSSNVFPDESSCVFPVVQKQVVDFIEILKKVRSMYKIVDNKANKSILFNDIFIISYCLSDGTSSLFTIGSPDFSKTMRYISLPGKNGIYKTVSDFEKFLTASASFWYDPFIIPQNTKESIKKDDVLQVNWKKGSVTKSFSDFEKIQKILSLRHGYLFAGVLNSELESEVFEIELSDGKSFVFEIYPNDSDGKILSYKTSDWDYKVHITNWTYNNLISLF